MPQLATKGAAVETENENHDVWVSIRMRQSDVEEVDTWADAEQRARSNLINIIVREALAARRAAQKKGK